MSLSVGPYIARYFSESNNSGGGWIVGRYRGDSWKSRTHDKESVYTNEIAALSLCHFLNSGIVPDGMSRGAFIEHYLITANNYYS